MTDSVLKSDGSIRYSEELQEMAKPISKYQVWGAVLIGEDIRQKMVVPPQAKLGLALVLPKVAALTDFLPKAKGFAFYANANDSEVKYGLGMKVSDSSEADKFSEAAKEAVVASIDQLMSLVAAQGMNVPNDVKEFVNNTAKKTKADRIGDVGYVVLTFDYAETKKLVDKYKNQLNNMGGGGFGPGFQAPNPQPPMKFPRPKR